MSGRPPLEGLGSPCTREDELREAAATKALDDDPEVARLSAYLAGALPDDESAQLRERLRLDPAFQRYAQPLLQAWQTGPRAVDVVREHPDLDAAWTATRERLQSASPDQGDSAQAGVHPERSRERYVPMREVVWRRYLLAMLIVSLIMPESVKMILRIAGSFAAMSTTIQVDNTAGEIVEISDKALISLAPGARLMQRNQITYFEMYLDGSATFTAERQEMRRFVLLTGTAKLECQGCSYDVDASVPGVTRVRLKAGELTVWQRGPNGALGKPMGAEAGKEMVVAF